MAAGTGSRLHGLVNGPKALVDASGEVHLLRLLEWLGRSPLVCRVVICCRDSDVRSFETIARKSHAPCMVASVGTESPSTGFTATVGLVQVETDHCVFITADTMWRCAFEYLAEAYWRAERPSLVAMIVGETARSNLLLRESNGEFVVSEVWPLRRRASGELRAITAGIYFIPTSVSYTVIRPEDASLDREALERLQADLGAITISDFLDFGTPPALQALRIHKDYYNSWPGWHGAPNDK
ncbi:NTP transferase domain-containing protein [Aquipuribacter sp. MA13-6]|uniref:NTP transferase domain-containing protein n=1 Tax=unclassified Aquipuribacter TaxID=2635084 RepID=UPI003EF01591